MRARYALRNRRASIFVSSLSVMTALIERMYRCRPPTVECMTCIARFWLEAAATFSLRASYRSDEHCGDNAGPDKLILPHDYKKLDTRAQMSKITTCISDCSHRKPAGQSSGSAERLIHGINQRRRRHCRYRLVLRLSLEHSATPRTQASTPRLTKNIHSNYNKQKHEKKRLRSPSDRLVVVQFGQTFLLYASHHQWAWVRPCTLRLQQSVSSSYGATYRSFRLETAIELVCTGWK